MIVILEGPDGAGKTTLAKQLHTWLSASDDCAIVHHGPYEGVVSSELARIYFSSLLNALTYNKHVILDRAWYSEPIYAAEYRKVQSRISIAQRRMLERCALSRQGVVIYCNAPLDACAQVFSTRTEYVQKAHIARVY